MFGSIAERLQIDRRTDAYTVARLLDSENFVSLERASEELARIHRFGRRFTPAQRADNAMHWLSVKFPRLFRVRRNADRYITGIVRIHGGALGCEAEQKILDEISRNRRAEGARQHG